DPFEHRRCRGTTLVAQQLLGEPRDLPKRRALCGRGLAHGVGGRTAQRLRLSVPQQLAARDELFDLVRMTPGELVHGPDRDARLAQRTHALGRLRLAGFPEARRQLVARGGELVEREAVEAVELGVELGDDGEAGGHTHLLPAQPGPPIPYGGMSWLWDGLWNAV